MPVLMTYYLRVQLNCYTQALSPQNQSCQHSFGSFFCYQPVQLLLSTDEISILSRGLTFCPTPRHINWAEVSADIYDFSRRMRLAKYFFDENSNTRTANEHDTPFHNKSTWNPPTTEKDPLTPF